MHVPPSLLNLLAEPPAARRVYDVPPPVARRSVAARAAPPSRRSRAQVVEHGRHAPVILGGGREPELPDDDGDVRRDRVLVQAEPLGDAGVGAALGHQLEHLALAGESSADDSSARRRATSSPTISGSSAEPPSATRFTADANSSTSATRSFSR